MEYATGHYADFASRWNVLAGLPASEQHRGGAHDVRGGGALLWLHIRGIAGNLLGFFRFGHIPLFFLCHICSRRRANKRAHNRADHYKNADAYSDTDSYVHADHHQHANLHTHGNIHSALYIHTDKHSNKDINAHIDIYTDQYGNIYAFTNRHIRSVVYSDLHEYCYQNSNADKFSHTHFHVLRRNPHHRR